MGESSTYMDICLGFLLGAISQRIANILGTIQANTSGVDVMTHIISDLPIIIGIITFVILLIIRQHYTRKGRVQTELETKQLITDTVKKTIDEMGIKELIRDLPDNISKAIKQAYKDTHPQ